MESMQMDNKQQRQGRIIFFLMTVFFVVPVIVVVAMVKLNWKPTGHSYGELLVPPRLITNSLPLATGNTPVKAAFWQDKWNMVYVTRDCSQTCMGQLHMMRQLYVSLYKDMPRTQRVLITTSQDVAEIQSKYPDMLIINQPLDRVAQLAAEFNLESESAVTSNRLYLVDPLGHLVMSYRADITAQDIRKDLVRLLKYSWAG